MMDVVLTYGLVAVLGGLVLFALYHFGRLALGITSAFFDRRGAAAAAAYAEALGAFQREVAALPLPAARESAEPLFRGHGLLTVTAPAAAPAPMLAQLAPAFRECFSRAGRVEAPGGEPYIDVAELAPFEGVESYIRLGQADEHAHVCARPGDDRVFVLADDDADPEGRAEVFPSIYHWLLVQQRSAELLEEDTRPAA